MEDLVRIVGQYINSEAVRRTLSAYVPLVAEVLDLAPDEGVPKDLFLENVEAGICIKHRESGEVTTVFLFSQGRDGYAQYAGELGRGLDFSSTAEAARQALGAPSFYRAENSNAILGAHGEILRYDYPTYSLHLQFSVGGSGLELVTLMSPQVVPGRRR
jgi:hypothetical protein